LRVPADTIFSRTRTDGVVYFWTKSIVSNSNFNHAVGVMKNNYIRALLENDPVKMEELFSDIILQMSKKLFLSDVTDRFQEIQAIINNQKSNC
jgi:hypothetical protein